ncbi:hypothetical protein BH11MYX4_BH11MYX4_30340 [soil metagenome]
MPNANATRAGLFAVALGGFVFLLSSGHVPCAFARIFHTPCPGCGSTRAMLALATGDVHAFVRYNPMAPFMTLLIVALIVQAFASLLATGTFRRVGDGVVGMLVSRGAIVIASIQFAIWVARFMGFMGGPVPV